MENEYNKTRKSSIYIDEAVDLGIQRGTQWFVITGVIVAEEDEKRIREVIRQIKNRLNIHEIHLRKIHDFFRNSLYIISKLKIVLLYTFCRKNTLCF